MGDAAYHFIWSIIIWLMLIGAGDTLFIILIVLIIATALAQLFLSRRNKWLGFIPPIVYFAYSVFFTLSTFSAMREPDDSAGLSALLIGAGIMFFLSVNIFTVILLILHGLIRAEKKRKAKSQVSAKKPE